MSLDKTWRWDPDNTWLCRLYYQHERLEYRPPKPTGHVNPERLATALAALDERYTFRSLTDNPYVAAALAERDYGRPHGESMTLIVSATTTADREPIPTGMQQAVCAFVEDIGYELNTINQKLAHKLVVIFEMAEKMADGRPFIISKRYTLSLHEKASLRKDLVAWRGREFTEDELKGFDLHKLIGANCLLNITERQAAAGGKVYANISGIAPLMKGQPKIAATLAECPKWVAETRKKNEANSQHVESVGDDDHHHHDQGTVIVDTAKAIGGGYGGDEPPFTPIDWEF